MGHVEYIVETIGVGKWCVGCKGPTKHETAKPGRERIMVGF